MCKKVSSSKVTLAVAATYGLALAGITVVSFLIGVFGWKITLFDLENIIFGVLALIAACISLYGIRQQIEQQISIHEDTLKRARISEKALLPSKISKLCAIAKIGARHCWNPSDEPKVKFSEFDALVNSLKDSIQYCEPQNAKKIAEICATSQILAARNENGVVDVESHSIPLTGLIPLGITANDAAYMCKDWLIFLKMLTDCFPYARGQSDTIPDFSGTTDDLYGGLRFCGIELEVANDISQRFKKIIKSIEHNDSGKLSLILNDF